MRNSGRMVLFLIFSSIFLLAGCMEMAQTPDSAMQAPQNGQTSNTASRRFQDTVVEGPTPVESAIELSKKYAAVSEELSQLKVEKQALTEENRKIKQQVAVLRAEAEQAKKELAEANDLLIEMRVELNNWKADVLGFREEMRQADKVQLETLLKILEVLGGEPAVVTDPNTEPQDKQT